MKNQLLEVRDLSVVYPLGEGGITALDSISFSMEKESVLGIVGESGSGKTSVAMAIMGLLDKKTKAAGEICYEGIDLQVLSHKERNAYRWKEMALVFQNHLDVLNPLLTIAEQIAEGLRKENGKVEKESKKKVGELLELVGLDSYWGQCYPHQLSGGMRQRVLIAMALAGEPKLLLVDEPTTALDGVSKKEILSLLKKLQKSKKISMMVISHDIGVIQELTSKVLVLYDGVVLEEGYTKEILYNPMHTYTRGLIHASLELNPYQDLWGIPGEAEGKEKGGCTFYGRCTQKLESCKENKPLLKYASLERKVACNQGGIVTLLEGRSLSKSFSYQGRTIKACIDCSLKVASGEILVLLGQSGSGKTTLASILSGHLKAEEGEVFFQGFSVEGNNMTARKEGIQMIFQDPFSATNGNFTVAQAVQEPLHILKLGTEQEREQRMKDCLREVQLSVEDHFLNRKCANLSGGQRQRVAIARSLIMEPKLLIADEISSMLDPSTKANTLRLLKGLQNSRGFAMVYITHDILLARKIADQVYIMHEGKVVEKGSCLEVFDHPKSEYGKLLMSCK
ncbi:MAG: ABC transporter ATP-binding protein [Thermotaleaceae bacterium]